MRTTIRLDDQLLREAKAAATLAGRSLTDVIEDALRESLTRSARRPKREPIQLPTMPGRLLPGVDLDDSAALLDVMEAADGPPRR